jgi:hypothetical protein
MLYRGAMKEDLKALEGYVSRSAWPHVPCPVCEHGFLAPEVLDAVQSAESQRARSHDSWEPDWISGTFHGMLKCAVPACAETVSIVGDFKVGPTIEPNGNWHGGYDDLFRLRFARPALTILTLPSETPDNVKEAIEGTSQVLWIDPSAAANRMRFAIEALLTCRHVRRFVVAHGKQRRLTTHDRITEFKNVTPRQARHSKQSSGSATAGATRTA